MDIYDKIKFLREKLNLSQEELAERMGYKSKTSIHKIEQKKTDLPLSKVKEFAKVLKTTPEFLMGYENGKIPMSKGKRVLTAEQEADLKYITENNVLFFKRNNLTDSDIEKLETIIKEFYIETLEEE